MKLVADIKKKRNNLANGINIFRRSDILYNCHILITVSNHTPKKLKNIFSKLLSLHRLFGKRLAEQSSLFS